MKNTPTSVATSMPKTTAVPSACRAPAPAPSAIASGTRAQDERERRHQDRPQPEPGAVQRRLLDRLALLALELGELDDEDGVLRREPDQHDQPDLRVDVVVEAPQTADPGTRRTRRTESPAGSPPASPSSRRAPPARGSRTAATPRRCSRSGRRSSSPGRSPRSTRRRSPEAARGRALPSPRWPGRSCSPARSFR